VEEHRGLGDRGDADVSVSRGATGRPPARLRHAHLWIVVGHHPTRRKRMAIATPRWVDRRAINALREEARRLTETTGIRHELDHIYPICSDTVCGLHVHTNLRIVTAVVNLAKSNRWEETYE
jgi:hypothetical protein